MLAFAAGLVSAQAMTPSVTVEGQALTVTVQSVLSDGPGWLVIHADNKGAPGAVLGWAPLSDGENSNVVVPIDPAGLTPTVWAMLHIDAGVVGTYENPGPDAPVMVDGAIVESPCR